MSPSVGEEVRVFKAGQRAALPQNEWGIPAPFETGVLLKKKRSDAHGVFVQLSGQW